MNGNGNSEQPSWGKRWRSIFLATGAARPTTGGVRVRQLEVTGGRIDVTLHRRDQDDCTVSMPVTELDDAQWEAVLDVLSSQAIYAAQLLAGDMPPDIQRAFERAGTSLYPATQDIQFESTCGSASDAAREAVHTALGEMLDDDPWLLFRLRGRDRQQVLRALRTRRNRMSGAHTEQTAADESTLVYRSRTATAGPQEVPPLAAQPERFWGSARDQLELQHYIAPPMIEAALLRRLGPAPFDEAHTANDLLANVYRLVTANGLALAFAPEPEEDVDAEAVDLELADE